MTPLSDIPINTWTWGVGSAALVVLGIRSTVGYRRSRGQLSKYMAWFSWIYLPCLLAYAIPAIFTLDPETLRRASLVGEFFFWIGFVVQAAILWCLILRRYCSIYAVTVPVAIIGLACFLYDIPTSRIVLSDNFINYYPPRIVSLATAGLMTVLFVPVGIYFIKAASWQSGAKATVTSFVMGMMYAGMGLSIASQEIISKQLVTPSAAVVDLIIGLMLFTALVIPWNLSVKLPAQVQTSVPPKL